MTFTAITTIVSCFRSKMDEFEAEDGRILGSLLLEPVLMGAGGMIFVDPLFQRVLVQVRALSGGIMPPPPP